MNWKKIRQQYPNQFILLGDLEEEEIRKNIYRILGGTILKTSNDFKEIRQAYRNQRQKGKNVLYTFPNTPEDLIVENIPFKGILK